MDIDIPSTIVAMVHDRVGGALASALSGGASPFVINFDPRDKLVAQLEDTKTVVPRVSAGFIGDIAVSSVSTVAGRLRALSGVGGPAVGAGGSSRPNPADVLNQVRNAIRSGLPFRSSGTDPAPSRGPIEGLIALLDRDGPDLEQAAQEFRTRFDGLVRGLVRVGDADSDARVSRLKQILGNDMATVMPFAAIANAVQGQQNAADVPKSIEEALLAYFFAPKGYETVDGESVIAPVHVSDLKAIAAGAVDVGPGPSVTVSAGPAVKQLKGLFTTATAEQYLRDTTRVVVESAYDAIRGFRDTDGRKGRYTAVTEALKGRKPARPDQDAVVEKFVRWFRGFSSMAESAAMRAVEVGTQGVSEFQTNPLIAAAAGAFAGTVARKLSQGAFLAVLSTDLGISQ